MRRRYSVSVKMLSLVLICLFFVNLGAIPAGTESENTDYESFRKNDSKLMLLSYIVSGSSALIFTGLSLMLAPPVIIYSLGLIESAFLSLGKKDFENILSVFKGSFAAVTTICIIAAVLTDILVFF